MLSQHPAATEWYGYYKPLLERYARRILRDEAAALKMVQRVLDFHWVCYGDACLEQRRLRLKESTRLHCFYFLQCRSFDRPPLNTQTKRSFL